MKSSLIAQCGMNCGVCIGYLRDKNKCSGCREDNQDYCRKCTIKNCKILKENNWKFCSDKCKKYPCTRLKNLDKRYRAKYKMSMLENLESIRKFGIREFVKNERERWKCKKCRNALSVHRDKCLVCGNKR